ncbi:hypothetical protein BpHYR1_005899 [Brachionus plicatilis]|uniref:Uncharacterized protein n=1 Tax=Brachionus plicatilis TaxID=10195 RepID=A0A3M7QMB7_BRAPC|nr:hypothetical protein BpHYR1_005899 [Brachionus plicatilis]
MANLIIHDHEIQVAKKYIALKHLEVNDQFKKSFQFKKNSNNKIQIIKRLGFEFDSMTYAKVSGKKFDILAKTVICNK